MTAAGLPRRPASPKSGSARRQVAVAALLGVAPGVATGLFTSAALGALAGWDVTAAAYGGIVWWRVARLDAEQTAEFAVREDPSRRTAELLVLGAAVASLAAVAVVIAGAHGSGASEVVPVLAAVGSVVVSWAVLHTVFLLRYAGMYYHGVDGGIDFNQQQPPRYLDFAYVAFTIGMTFQVSDTQLTDSTIRAAALRQALLSYLFGAFIIAGLINLVAGLTK